MPAVPFFAAGFLLCRCLLIFISHLLKAQRTHRKIEELETFLPRKKITFAHFLQKIKGTEALRPFSSGNGMVSLHLHFSRTTWVSRALKFQFVFPGKNQIFWKERLYIYTYIREIIVVRRWTTHCPALRNGKMTLSKKTRNSRSNSLEQNSSFGAIELKLFLCYSRFCRTAKQPALTSKMCTWHVQGTLSSHPHPTPPCSPYNDCHTGVASKMCTCARNVIIPSPPHPNPPHCDHRRTTTISGIYIYIYTYIIYNYLYMIYTVYIYIQLKQLETQEEKQNLKMMYSVLPTLEKKDSPNSTCVSTLQILPIRPLSFSLWACCRDRRPPWQWIDLNVQPQKCQSGKHVLEICV